MLVHSITHGLHVQMKSLITHDFYTKTASAEIFIKSAPWIYTDHWTKKFSDGKIGVELSFRWKLNCSQNTFRNHVIIFFPSKIEVFVCIAAANQSLYINR